MELVLKFGAPLMTVAEVLYKKEVEKKKEKAKHDARLMLLKRILVYLVALLCAVLLFAATAKALIDLKVLNVRSIVSVAATDLPTDSYGHTNVLLLGKGDANHDGIDLTDTIMIASLDPTKTKSAVLLSVPRDLYLLKTEHMGVGKINTMYRDYKTALIRQGKTKEEASKLAMTEMGKELGLALGIQIHEVVMVDFSGFVQAVDAVGGVDVDVTKDLMDTEYPANETSYTTFEIHAGPQHLDGETALKYARSRHSTSDFDRSRRQQQILKALSDKMKSGGMLARPDQIVQLISILKEHVDTTLAVRDMLGLAKIGESIDPTNLYSVQLNDQNGLYGAFVLPGGLLYTPPRDQFKGSSVLLPVSLPAMPITWKQIQLLVHLQVDNRMHFVDNQPVDILNAGAKPGSGKKMNDEFTRFGIATGRVTNADNKEKLPTSVIRASADNKDYATYLSQNLKIKLELQTDTTTTNTDNSGASFIRFLLGKDYTYTPLQSLLPSK